MAIPRFRNAEEARRRFDPRLVDQLEAGLEETDVVGDAIVAACSALPGSEGIRASNAWLDGGQTPRGELGGLLEHIAETPAWVDWERLRRGSIAYWRGGPLVWLTLTCASLAAGYRSGAAVKPLVLTGRLSSMAYRRQQETARWMLAATAPDGLQRGGSGFKETVRVRIVHAGVRRGLLRSGRWDDAWGAPINISDVAYGIAGEFSTIPVAALQDAGVHFTRRERNDIQHMWRYIGHLLGVPEELLSDDDAGASQLIAIKDLTDTPADEDSRALVRALIEDGSPLEELCPQPLARAAKRLLPTVLYGMTRRWAGAEVADELHLPDTPAKHLVRALRPVVQAGELARRMSVIDEERLAERWRMRLERVLERGHAPQGVVAEAEAEAAAAVSGTM